MEEIKKLNNMTIDEVEKYCSEKDVYLVIKNGRVVEIKNVG